MVWRFNPPPGWPAPPAGWTPPAGWAPDPSWPPLPPGWSLWIEGDGRGDAGGTRGRPLALAVDGTRIAGKDATVVVDPAGILLEYAAGKREDSLTRAVGSRFYPWNSLAQVQWIPPESRRPGVLHLIPSPGADALRTILVDSSTDFGPDVVSIEAGQADAVPALVARANAELAAQGAATGGQVSSGQLPIELASGDAVARFDGQVIEFSYRPGKRTSRQHQAAWPRTIPVSAVAQVQLTQPSRGTAGIFRLHLDGEDAVPDVVGRSAVNGCELEGDDREMWAVFAAAILTARAGTAATPRPDLYQSAIEPVAARLVEEAAQEAAEFAALKAKNHGLGVGSGSIRDNADGTASYRATGKVLPAFTVRIADVTGFSVARSSKMLEQTLSLTGNGTILATVNVNYGTSAAIEKWFRQHPDFGGNASPAPAPAAPPPAGASVADELMKLVALHNAGALTDAEFAALKAKLIG